MIDNLRNLCYNVITMEERNMRCLCCGKEFKPNEDIQYLYGRQNGKTILALCKTLEYRTCSKECAAKIAKLVYKYFYSDSVEFKDNSKK